MPVSGEPALHSCQGLHCMCSRHRLHGLQGACSQDRTVVLAHGLIPPAWYCGPDASVDLAKGVAPSPCHLSICIGVRSSVRSHSLLAEGQGSYHGCTTLPRPIDSIVRAPPAAAWCAHRHSRQDCTLPGGFPPPGGIQVGIAVAPSGLHRESQLPLPPRAAALPHSC
jgi:hypothetical protein